MLSAPLLQRLWDMSDNVLYPEAVTFIRRLINEKGCSPLPTSQVMGLLNIANAANYSELVHFIRHQRERNWPDSKKDIKTFYTELDLWFVTLRNRLVRNEFRLLSKGLSPVAANREVDEIMTTLAHEFIQHLVAENGVLSSQKADEQRSRRR
ncbi:hypothetical protein KSF_053560 [Reticulibacter mediterranei]|uniref:Uncharacterized protein n=1 Tax=Reticulibacter mediterranei TaxID=2778369 RepID=A0A8J3IMV8_9CHLR|nr:hypothetical protein [Reticulibacter mediterranei]GHO95308.1 hypothetical protein KSF_053560 [Reticulibacter mediterranei]